MQWTLIIGVDFPLGAALGPKTRASLASLGLSGRDNCTHRFSGSACEGGGQGYAMRPDQFMFRASIFHAGDIQLHFVVQTSGK